MAVGVHEAIMVAGDVSIEVDFTPETYDALTVETPLGRRPANLYVLVRNLAGDLLYPPFVLRRVDGDETGLKIGGPGILWSLGAGGIGPTITFAEYLSGANKLSNPVFALNPPDTLWRTPSEDSAWVIVAGEATCAGGRDGDDIFEPDERWGTRPGLSYVAAASGLAYWGRTRVRTLYEGRFNPPNLFPPLVTGGAWGTQTTNNPTAAENAFEVIADSPTAIGRSDLALRAKTPFPIYQLVQNPVFDLGGDGENNWFTGGDARWVADGSAAPDLPTSIHYEGSGFITADVVITNTSDVLTSATANWTSPSAVGMLVEGPDIPPFTYVLGVSGPGTLQMSAAATADHLAGDQAVAFRPQTVDTTYFTTDATDAGGTANQYAVTKGETWDLYCHVMKTDNANGTATISFAKVKTATDDHLAGVFWEQAESISTGGGTMVLSTAPEPAVRVITKQTTIEEETTALGVHVQLVRNTDGRWWFSNFLLQRVIGNIDSLLGQTVNVTGERTVRFTLPCKGSTVLVDEATARLIVILTGPGRDDITLRSADQKQTKGEVVNITLDVKAPSGYTTATAHLEIQDVFNDYFYFGEMDVRDIDTATMVFDSAVGAATVSSTAPAGAESVRVQLVAEEGATASVHGLSLIRTTASPATGEEIATALLLDPDTGLAMSIGAGTINAPDTIPNDIELVHRTSRDALDHLCNVVYPGGLEYRVTAEVAPLLDVASADTLFVDHAPGTAEAVVLLGGMVKDPDVEGVNPPETDVSDRATEIVVIGAERQLVSGGTLLVTATAQVPGPVEYDLHNRPIVRRRYVNAGTVDHFGYAQALADDLAEREAQPALVVPIVLNEIDDTTATALDVPLRPAYGVGDWIYVDKPEAGLRDLDNATMIDGTTYFPRRVRVLERERALLNGTIEMLRPDGTTFVLAGVTWSEASETRLVVGDRLPEWVADPQGRSEGVQYVEDRRSRPR